MLQPTPAHRWYVYAYVDTRPEHLGDVIYVGKGTMQDGRRPLKRMHSHWLAKSLPNVLFFRVLEKIRDQGLEPMRAPISWHQTELEAFEAEKAAIAKHRLRVDGGSLCNLTLGGEGPCGYRASAEVRQKIGAALKVSEAFQAGAADRGRALSANPEIVARRANTLRITANTAQARMAASERAKKAFATPEAKASRSAAMTCNWQNPDFVEKMKSRPKPDMKKHAAAHKAGIANMNAETKARLSKVRSDNMKARHAARTEQKTA